MNLFDLTLDYLATYFYDIRNRPLGCTKQEIEHTILEFCEYAEIASPFLYKISLACHSRQSRSLSLLFLPCEVKKRSITLTVKNCEAVMKCICDSSLFSNKELQCVEQVVCSRWSDTFDEVNLSLVKAFLSKLPHLKIVKLCAYTDDIIISYLLTYCKNLEIFDCSNDCWCTVTDVGLSMLSRLQKLRYVLFSEFADEYEEEDEKLKFSAAGLADLMLTLPDLVEVRGPDYIVWHAIKALDSSKVQLKLENMDLGIAGVRVQALHAVCRVCPCLQSLGLTLHLGEETAIAAALCTFKQLKKLSLTRLEVALHEMKFNIYGPQLTDLNIKKDKFTKDEFLLLSSCCVSLIFLCVFDQCRINDTFRSEDLLMLKEADEPFFPCLEKLDYRLRDVYGLLLFFRRTSSLISLCAKVGLNTEAIDVLDQLKPHTYLKNLEMLIIPDLSCTIELVINVVLALPKLKYINVLVNDRDAVKRKIFSHGLSVKLGDIWDDHHFVFKISKSMDGAKWPQGDTTKQVKCNIF